MRRLLLPIGGVVLVLPRFIGFSMYREGQLYVSTENAQLTGTPVQVGAMNAGRVDSIMPNIGSTVHKGDVIAPVALPSQVGIAQNGQPKMGFLGAGDSTRRRPVADRRRRDRRAGHAGRDGPGRPGDRDDRRPDAAVGQRQHRRDQHRRDQGRPASDRPRGRAEPDVPGRVEAVTPATAGTFSLLPTSNTSGNFTKVTQLVPVRISVNLGNQPVLLGSPVEVKIRVA